MKKNLCFILLICMCCLLSGCGTKEKKTECTNSIIQNASGYQINSEYVIYSKKNIVSKVSVKHQIESQDSSILDNLKNDLIKQYDNYNSIYGGYTYKLKEETNKVIINLTTDYETLDMDKFYQDNYSIRKYLNDDKKLTLEGIKNMYSTSGIKCK